MAEISDLLLLQQKLRECKTKSELGNLVVNETGRLFDYQSAVLWIDDGLKGGVQAVSNLPQPIKHIPFTSFIEELSQNLHGSEDDQVRVLDTEELTREQSERWREFLPNQVVWVPLESRGRRLGGLLLGRQDAWQSEELGLLKYWGGAVGHAALALWYGRLGGATLRSRLLDHRVLWISLAVVFLLCWLPVSLSVNATAEVVAKDPRVVRSPIDGIVGEVKVAPNLDVVKGDLIMTFDDTAIRAELDVVKQELAIARAEYQRATQAAVFDREASAELPMLKARVEQQEAQVQYNESVLERSRIFAEDSGIAIIPIASELEGRPVRIGEKLFVLAEPGQVELEFWVAVGDSIPLPEGAEVGLFLNVQPDRAYPAALKFISYQAEVSPDGILGYRGRAALLETRGLRIGWRGTAKLYGDTVPLVYLVLRRPLAVARQWLGL